jgi:hypothetical protein
MVKQGVADASQKPIDPSSLSTTEALAGTFVATVFQFVQLNTVTPKVLNDAVALMYERTGIAQIKGTSRAPPPPPPDDSNITTAATAQEIWTVYKKVLGDQGIFLLNIAALGNNENGKHTSVRQVQLSALGKKLVDQIPNLRAGKGKKKHESDFEILQRKLQRDPKNCTELENASTIKNEQPIYWATADNACAGVQQLRLLIPKGEEFFEVADLKTLGERDWEEPLSVLGQMPPHEYPVIKYNDEILFIIAATKEYVIAVRFFVPGLCALLY